MADKTATEEAPNTGSGVAAQEEEDPIFPSINKTTKPPSLGHAHPPSLNYPPATFRSGLNVPASFSVPPAQMQPFLTYNSQPLWAGNSLPDLHPFLPMPNLPGQIAAPFAGSGYGFPPAGATVNPFSRDPFTQFPAGPFNPCGSNALNVSSCSNTPATFTFCPSAFRLHNTILSRSHPTVTPLNHPSLLPCFCLCPWFFVLQLSSSGVLYILLSLLEPGRSWLVIPLPGQSFSPLTFRLISFVRFPSDESFQTEASDGSFRPMAFVPCSLPPPFFFAHRTRREG